MAHIEDRWHRDGPPGPDGKPAKVKTARYGTGRRWRVRYIGPDGKEHSESFARKADADACKDNTAADVRRGTWMDPDAGLITFRKYAEDWLAAQTFGPSTAEAAERRLRLHAYPVLGDVPLRDLAARPAVIQRWRAGLPAGSAAVIFGTVSSVLGAAVAEERIRRNPCQVKAIVKVPKRSQRLLVPWEPSRVAAVQAALPARYSPLVTCGADLGMRQGEIFAQSPDDLIRHIRHGRAVHVQRQVKIVGNRPVFAPPKGGKERDVPLPAEVEAELMAHADRFGLAEVSLPWLTPDGPLVTARLFFANDAGGAIYRSTFNHNWWARALKAAGVEPGRENGMHALRHYYASVMLAGGVDIRALSEFLGHTDPGFTLRVYAHLVPDAVDRARLAVSAARAARSAAPDGPATAQGAS